MTRRLPALSAKEVLRVLRRAGFEVVRTSGSHHYLVHQTDPRRRVVVAYHGSKDLRRGTLLAIIEQAGLTIDEFLDLN